MKFITALTLLILGSSALTPVSAAQFTRGPHDYLYVTGSIGEGDDARFAAALDDSVRTVSLTSSGGRLAEAMAIGRLVRAHKLDTEVPISCASSCALIWASGVKRTAVGRVAMHCPIAGELQCLPSARASMIAYLREMNAPSVMVQYQEAAGSTSALYVEPEKLAQMEPPPNEEPYDAPPRPRRYVRPPAYHGPAYPPPLAPGFIELPGGRIVPCALMWVGLPICI